MDEEKDNVKIEEKSKTKPASKVTTEVKETKVKNPGRVAAGKKLAEANKKKREEKKKLLDVEKNDVEKQENNNQFPITVNQMIGIAGVCISAYSLYMRREELMGYFSRKEKEVNRKSEDDNEVKEEKKNKKVVFKD